MLNARFKDLTEAQFCWLGLTAEWQSQCFILANRLVSTWLDKEANARKTSHAAFFCLVQSFSMLCPVKLFLSFLFPFAPRKKNVILCSQKCFSCLCFKSCEVLGHPWRQSTSWGKSVAETLQRVPFEMYCCWVFSLGLGQSDHQIWV